MDAYELYRLIDGEYKPTGVWACGKCNTLAGGADQPNTREYAEAHCRPVLCECGKEALKHRTTCQECSNKRFNDARVKHEAELLAKAAVIDASSYSGPVYDGDRYYIDYDDMLTTYDDYGDPLPTHVYACHVEQTRVNPDTVMEHILEDISEGMDESFEESDMVGCGELRKAIEKWNAEQDTKIWTPDYSRVILVVESSVVD